jgi:hypothetical protein
LNRALYTLKIGTGFFGALLGLVLLAEAARGYRALQALHPLLGYLFLLLLLGLTGWCGWMVTGVMRRFPRVPVPPDPEALGGPESPRYRRARLEYDYRLFRVLQQNPNLSDYRLDMLRSTLADRPGKGRFRKPVPPAEYLRFLDVLILEPALKELDQRAEELIRRAVRDTMVTVLLSPWRTADLVFVLYHNLSLFLALVRCYYVRPGLLSTIRILFDVLQVVAAVNLLNFMDRFTERLMARVPLLDRATDDLVQGFGAGLLTAAVGKTTMRRCRLVTPWNREQERSHCRTTAKAFLGYVREIFHQEILPGLSRPWVRGWHKVKGIFGKAEREVGYAGS